MKLSQQELQAYEAISHEVAESESLLPQRTPELAREARMLVDYVRRELGKLRAPGHLTALQVTGKARASSTTLSPVLGKKH